jgi:hypothetical protein
MCDGRARLKCAGCGDRVCHSCYGLPRLPRGTWYCDLCRSTGWPSQVTSHPSCALCQRAHVPGAAHVGPMMSTTAGELVHATCAHYLPGASAEDTHAHTHARTRTRTRTRARAHTHPRTPYKSRCWLRPQPSWRPRRRQRVQLARAAYAGRPRAPRRSLRHLPCAASHPPTRAPRAPPRSSAHIAPPTHHTTSPTRAHPPHPPRPVLFLFRRHAEPRPSAALRSATGSSTFRACLRVGVVRGASAESAAAAAARGWLAAPPRGRFARQRR